MGDGPPNAGHRFLIGGWILDQPLESPVEFFDESPPKTGLSFFVPSVAVLDINLGTRLDNELPIHSFRSRVLTSAHGEQVFGFFR